MCLEVKYLKWSDWPKIEVLMEGGSGGSWGKPIPSPSAPSRGCRLSLACGPFIHLQSQELVFLPLSLTSASLTLSPFPYKEPCDCSGPPEWSRIVSHLKGLDLSHLQSPFHHIDNICRFQGLGCGHVGGDHCAASHTFLQLFTHTVSLSS